jgi:hypothetical protein
MKLKCTLWTGNPAVHADATRLILEDGRPKILAIHAAEAVSRMN